MFRQTLFVAATALLFSAGGSVAQTTTPSPSADQIQPASVTTPQDFANKAGPAGQFEIQSSQLAVKVSRDPTVTTFAKKMIEDHTKAAADLKSAAASNGVTVPLELDANSAADLQRLQAAAPADFDQLYIQMQTEAHIAAVGLYAGYAQNGQEGSIKVHANQTLPTLKMHYDMVLKLRPAG